MACTSEGKRYSDIVKYCQMNENLSEINLANLVRPSMIKYLKKIKDVPNTDYASVSIFCLAQITILVLVKKLFCNSFHLIIV